MLHQQIKDEIKKAMLAKEAERLSALRNISTAMTSESMAKGHKPDELIDDDGAITVLKRLSKQRKESIEQFTIGNRPEMAEKEKAELAIVESFLPAQMSRADILKIAETKKAELNITDKAKFGQLMGAVTKELKSSADGNLVKEVVEGLFA
ncbi:MAG: GatB/YqeY domain-containing protein [Candidatus Vogelbacteria bacterium]|nr:GatB/YqeY domain-containing protein [Candidatus Vogelbacteria bacterium]